MIRPDRRYFVAFVIDDRKVFRNLFMQFNPITRRLGFTGDMDFATLMTEDEARAALGFIPPSLPQKARRRAVLFEWSPLGARPVP